MAVWSQVKLSALSGDFRIDAEYYRPEFLKLRRAVVDGRWPVQTVEQLSRSVINFGAYSLCNDIVFQDPEDCDAHAVRFITAQDIQNGFIDYANARWISQAQHKGLLWKSQIKRGQVLVAMAARLGHAAVYDEPAPLNSSQDIAKIEVRDEEAVDPYYLAIYLNSAIGRNLLLASQTGSVQQHTNLGCIKTIPVAIIPRDRQRTLAATYRKAIEKRKQSSAIIASAEATLVKALGLSELNLAAQKCYSRRFSDLVAGNRFGAEYYMPCKSQVLKALASLPHKTVVEHAPSIRDIWDPMQVVETDQVRNYDVTDALDSFIDDHEPQVAAQIGSTKKRFRAGDVVISRLRSYLKEIAVVKTSDTFPTVGSSEFIVLRPKGDGLSAETLMVFLRSLLVQTILKWSQDGSNHPRFAEEDLLAIPVPDAVLSVREQIDSLAKEAFRARRESERLIEDASRNVESLVTGTADGWGR